MRYIQLLVLILLPLFSIQLNAQTSTKKPATTAKKPTTAAKKPATTAKKPATTAKKPATTAKKPTTAAKKPATTAKKPATTAKKPTTAAKKPTTAAKKPTTVAKKSTVVKKKPTTAKKPTPKAPLASTARKTTQVGTTKCAELTKIAQIQCCLREKGYDPGETDNTLNTKTRQALAQFQKDNHLPEGDLSIETMRALGVSK